MAQEQRSATTQSSSEEKESDTTAATEHSSSENTLRPFAGLQETQAQKKARVGEGSAALQAVLLRSLPQELPFLREEE